MHSTTRRTGIAAAAVSLVLGTGLLTAGPAAAADGFDFDRIEGPNRYATSAKAATAFGQADTVILASGESGRYPDALTANYLSGLRNAPVLLTQQDETPEEVKKAISDIGADKVVIIGGPLSVSESQEKSLRGTYEVSRIAGQNRFDTAAQVIAEGDEARTDTALLATGMNFPDALGAGPVAFSQKMPLAITMPNDAPDDVVAELKKAGISKVLVLGGKNAVSDDVVQELENKGITLVERFAGGDRSETSTKFAEYAMTTYDIDETGINVASGVPRGDGADALSGAPLTGKQNRALLITSTDKAAGDAVLTFLGDHAEPLADGVIFGGENALAQSVEYAMEKAVLGSGAQNARSGDFYADVQSAIDAAEKDDTITVFGEDNGSFRVTKSDLTIQGEDGASVSGAAVIQGADDVTVAGLTVTPTAVANQVAGFYLNDVDGIVISDNEVVGTDRQTGAGVINETGGEPEVARISGNFLHDLRQGVYANPSAEFTITENDFRRNAAGSANDAKSVITNNKFINNDEGVGLAEPGSTVTDNEFANNDPHVGDYTSDKAYDLEQIIEDNSFDEPVVVSEDDTQVRDES